MTDHLLLDDQFNGKKLETNEDIVAANKARTDLNESSKAILGGRNAIIFAIILLTVGTIVEVVREPELLSFSTIGFVVIGGTYGLSYYVFTKKPVIGLAICLAVFVLLNVLILFGNPASFRSGIVVKLFIIYFLVKGIYHARLFPEKLRALEVFELSEEDRQNVEKYAELKKLHYRKPTQ